MEIKVSFNKKLLAVVLAITCVFSTSLFLTPASVEAATTTEVAVNAVTPTDGDASTFSWDNATVYFVLTDRFQNGDTSNDHAYGRALDANGNAISGWNTHPGTFHGGDFKGMTQKINDGYFNDLGVNALWLTAPYEQMHGFCGSSDASGGFAHYAYHGYYTLDYTETDKNLGTKEEFRELVDAAHAKGIRVVLDIVMNHAGYATLADMDQYSFARTTGNTADYKYLLWNVTGYHNIIEYGETNPSQAAIDGWAKWWGSDWLRAGLAGYSKGSGELNECVGGLPDFKTESEATVNLPNILKTKWTQEGTLAAKTAKYGSTGKVRDYLSTWLAEWVEEFGVDGFRCDTAKHVDMKSWALLKQKCVTALDKWKANNPDKALDDLDFWMTGEHWNHGLGKSDYFNNGFDSIINFSFGGNEKQQGGGMPNVSSINSTYANYASQINNDPSFNVLSYISSHDTNLVRDNMVWQGSALLMLPGGVQIFYGDETARPMLDRGLEDHSTRSDMNWSAATSSNNVYTHWQKVGKFRNNHIAVGAGSHTAITSSSGAAFIRDYAKGNISDTIAACIGANANSSVTMNVSGAFSDGTVVTNAYDGTTATVSGGQVTFNSGTNGTILLEGPTSSISLNVEGSARFEGSQTVKAVVKGADYATVQVDGGTPFQVTDGQTFSIGANTALGGTVKVKISASNSADSLEKTFTFTKIDPNAVTRIYFDNSSYNWSAVYAYIYDESGSTVIKNATWPGAKMTLDSATGYYVIEVPDNLLNGNVIFTESENATTNRYPADGVTGLAIDSTDHLFSSGNKWAVYTKTEPDPTTVPITTTEPPVGTQIMRGDANLDNEVDLIDVLRIQKHVARIITLTENNFKAADVYTTGASADVVDILDALAIQQYLAEFSNTLKIGEYFTVDGGTTPTTTNGNPTVTTTLPITTTAPPVTTTVPDDGTRTVYVGVINYVMNNNTMGSAPRMHYWGGAAGNGNAVAVDTGKTVSAACGSNYWSNAAQTFQVFAVKIPSDATGMKFRHQTDDGNTGWYGNDITISSNSNTCYLIFEWSNEYHNLTTTYTP